MRKTAIAIAAVTSLAAAASSWGATPLSVRDSWRIGSAGTSFCSAQSLTVDKALTDLFDAGSAITCRDAALPVGRLYTLRDSSDAAARIASARSNRARCEAHRRGNLPGLGAVDVAECKLKDADVAYRAYQLRRGKLIYAAEGLAGYDSALQLGLRSLVADQPVKGEISIATTGLGDPAAFARVQAGTLAPDKALEEAYRRNNAGSYAEAAEFFAAAGGGGSADAPHSRVEALVNEALPSSPAPPSWSARMPSSPDACATIARSTTSTSAIPKRRSPSSTSRCQRPSQPPKTSLRRGWRSTK